MSLIKRTVFQDIVMTNLITLTIYVGCVCIGDITAQGFEKKKAKLLSPYLSSGEFLMLSIL